MVLDLTEGRNGVLAGCIGEVACDYPLDEFERKSLIASVKAQVFHCCTIMILNREVLPEASFRTSSFRTPLYKLFYDRGLCHVETSPLICRENQWTGFNMIRDLCHERAKQLNTYQ